MNKNIVLINSPINFSILQQKPDKNKIPLNKTHIPLGLITVSSILKKNGFNVKLIDLWAFPISLSELECEINEIRPQIIGLNTCSPTITATLELAIFLKSKWKTIKIIVGGSHASAVPLKLKKYLGLIDYIVVGQSEYNIKSLINHILNGKEKVEISKIISSDSFEKKKFLRDENGNFFTSPNLSVLQIDKYLSTRNEIPLISSYGCEFNCSYCSVSRVFGKKKMLKPIHQLLNEIEFFKYRYKCSHFKFISENFYINNKYYFNELLMALNEQKINWRCQLRVDRLNMDEISKLHRAGCVEILFGVDTVNSTAIKLSKKQLNIDNIIEIAPSLKKIGLKTQAVFIIGFPGESIDEMIETISFAVKIKRLGIDEITFFPLMQFPGTDIWNKFSPKYEFGALPIFNSKNYIFDNQISYYQKYSLIPESSCIEEANRVGCIMTVLDYAYKSIWNHESFSNKKFKHYILSDNKRKAHYRDISFEISKNAYYKLNKLQSIQI